MDEKEKFEKGEVPENASRLPWLVLIVIVVIGLGGFWWTKKIKSGSFNFASNKYQAVFLSNGQTYYGKLHDFDSQHPGLTDVYYLVLQPQANVNIADEERKTLPTPTPAPQNFTVMKLIQDIHGPEDKIVFNKDAILFVEELRDDSQVLQAINNIKAQLGQ